MAAELLTILIKNNEIGNIKILETQLNVSQFADVAALFLKKKKKITF